MKIDLHVHTDISDGACNIEEILSMAKANNVTHLAIANHDTLAGLPEAIATGKNQGITIFPAIEISACNPVNNKKIHILGYNINLKGKNVTTLCAPVLQKRHKNSLWQIEQLTKAGYDLELNNIFKHAKGGTIYKQHIMAELIKKGYTDQIYSNLYQQLFKKNGICARDIEYVDASDAVRAIKADGGIAVLAHPGQLDSYDLIDELVQVGLDGIELNHEDHTPDDHKKIWEYQKKHNLILTGGSDFHGRFGTNIQIGDICCPEEYISTFTSARS